MVMADPPAAEEKEALRLAALARYAILDTPAEEAFDRIVRLAASVFDAPIALVSLVDATRQWFKAKVGLEAVETCRSMAFCAHAVEAGALLYVPDARLDARFAANPLVVGAPHIRTYAGAPLLTADGACLGTLCVIYTEPQALRPQQLVQLQTMAQCVVDQLELRRHDALAGKAEVELRTAFDALHAQEAFLSSMAEIAIVGGWTIDLETMQLSWTGETKRIHGVPDDHLPDIETAISFYAPEAREFVRTAVERAILHAEPFDFEAPFIKANGKCIWVRAAGKIISENGLPRHLMGSFQDITEQKQREMALATALRERQHALDQVNAYQAALDQHSIVAITDAKGDILFANDRFCEISGYERAELIGKNHRILNSGVHPRPFFIDMWRKIARGQSFRAEICNRTKAGGLYWVDTTIVPIMGGVGRPERYVSVRYDITERKFADAALRTAHDQLAGFFNVAVDLLAIVSLDGRFLRVSAAFESVLGYPPDYFVGRPLLEFVHPDDVAQTRKSGAALAGGVPITRFINRYRSQNGEYRYLEWRSTAANGVIFAAARDITDRIAYEGELEAARDRAEAATRSKSAFLANMSHEIRTPLNGVIGIAGALAHTALDERQKEMVALIQSSGETLERLVSDILDVSKIEAGKLDLHSAPFDLQREIVTATELLRMRADDKGVAFELVFGAGARGLFVGDAVRVRQIVSNLASNAVKFTAQGGIVVRVEVDDGAEGAAVIISVEDTGIGFDSETAERLFTRFEQADGSITRRFGGTGLGLAICQSLTHMMGGEISARSAPNQGSLFLVRLPLPRATPLAAYDKACATAAEQPAAVAADPEQTAPMRILLAEDHPTNQRVVALILEPFGVALTIAENGAAAVEAFSAARFDLVLMDMQMPVMDGLAATRALRTMEAERGLPRTPIAMLSANAMREHVEMAMEAGCDAHIAKPVTTQGLMAGIDAALEAVAAAPEENPAQSAAG